MNYETITNLSKITNRSTLAQLVNKKSPGIWFSQNVTSTEYCKRALIHGRKYEINSSWSQWSRPTISHSRTWSFSTRFDPLYIHTYVANVEIWRLLLVLRQHIQWMRITHFTAFMKYATIINLPKITNRSILARFVIKKCDFLKISDSHWK